MLIMLKGDIALVRVDPQDQGQRYYKRNTIPIEQLNLPKITRKPGKSRFGGKRYPLKTLLPPLVVVTFRSYALTMDDSMSDIFTDILIYFFDEKCIGWDAPPLPDFRNVKEHNPSSKDRRRKMTAVGLVPRKHNCNRSTHYATKKVVQVFDLPVPVYITVRSFADIQNRPMSDIATDAMMFFFDETMPGWDLAGDVPDDPPSP